MQVKVSTNKWNELTADCLVVGVKQGLKQPKGVLVQLDQMLEGQLASLLAEGDLSGKKKDTFMHYTFGKMNCKRVLFVGLGEQVTYETLRAVAARSIRAAIKSECVHVAFALDSLVVGEVSSGEGAHAIVEGAMLGGYRYKGFAQEERDFHQVGTISLVSQEGDLAEVEQGRMIGEALAAGTNLARELVNTPGNLLTPTGIAEAAVDVAKQYGMEYEVLEREDMLKYGMGGLLGVAQGSAEPPKLVAIKYKGRQTWDDVLGFVGKGISFDTGGISLKPREGMEEMIGDMGGAAAVIGSLEALGRLKPEVNVLAVIPCAENMPSGTALKPGDVITTMSGKTVEILNTDAEGRLILADGVTYAKKMGANYIVDIATLTGAVLVALGTCTTGVVTNNEEFVEEVMEAAAEAGEAVWRLPAFDPYKEQIKSKVADLKNTGGRYAGSITAGLFVGAFAEETPWVHLDIAGTSWAEKETDYSPTGGTGAMVRTLALLAAGRAE
ncbi:leucyl aminopeptidase [Ammoniphilus sp. CFH 90114]|uniref:leucyl aminopeptidase n=1 Tax=Ammoniphilus sp. CFH 90114 TaxID=2493665 RepID=UPI00100F6E6E|nr:leucyl aminopeptidase [Ammoniphilus sp. CFH 90114]RXT05871.1 leucyl aminopeptidase [Ammoniphilus sp. CFH 90114]